MTGIPLEIHSVRRRLYAAQKTRTRSSRNPRGSRCRIAQASVVSAMCDRFKSRNLTLLMICSNRIMTSLEHRPSSTSSMASIPCEDTSCTCISGASDMMANCRNGSVSAGRLESRVRHTSWSQASLNWKSGADGVSSSISWLTWFVNRAYLSRCKFVSRSSSAKPSSI